MRRLAVLAALLFLVPAARSADLFDLYTNPVLGRVPTAEGAREVKQLTPAQLLEHERLLPGAAGTLLVVKTNDNRWSKLLVQPGRQKVESAVPLPILLIDRYVTYKEGQEQTVQASGQALRLFPGFRFSLDLGQVVPEPLGGDLRLVSEGDKVHVEPIAKARLFLVTKPLPGVTPPRGEKVVVGEKFEPRYFNGTYRLHDDGRRTARLTLKVAADGDVSGSYYSDADGARYEVRGHIGNPNHTIDFVVTFPRSEQTFRGWLFTGDAKALVGTARIGGRETGFYALRVEP